MTQLDRIEDRQIDMDTRLRKIEMDVAEMRGEKKGVGRIAGWVHKVVALAIAAGAGLLGGHIGNLPGAH